MITSPCTCWTSAPVRDWLAGLLQPYFAFCLSSHFALSRSQSFLALLFCLLLAVLFCLLLAMLFSVLFILSPLLEVERCSASASSLRCSSRCPRTRGALFRSSRHWLVGRGSVLLFHHWPFGCGFCLRSSPETLCGTIQFPGRLTCTSNTTTQRCALRVRWPAVGARAPWSCSLQQRVLLTVTAVRRWFPTPLQRHCVLLWAVSTLITKAYIAASCHGVVRRFVRHRWRVIDPRVSLSVV